jgi:hypothetical protein
MEKSRKFISIICIMGMLLTVSLGSGCATKGQTGALAGAGAGAAIGGLANMHGSWGATALLGAGIGAGIGYLIGNEEDKKDAAKRQAATMDELKPLAGTTWQVISIEPKPKDEYKSIVANFRADGYVVTTKTNLAGKVDEVSEQYRVVGSTLILSKPDYVTNNKFRIEGNRLYIDYGDGSAVLQRIS